MDAERWERVRDHHVPAKTEAPVRAGHKIGGYEVENLIGAGGMGEVYRARDLRLKREVALKVLPEIFAADPDRMARFHREAEVLASLNHPNIAQIYGVDDRALVMELVDGKTLAGPLPMRTALTYAKQMAEALEYAHEKGVVHRDLKPANIKVTPSGLVKVLDFGLAKAADRRTTSGDPSLSPTETLAPTRSGMIMGTAAYMSPEQAAGQPVDKRCDIWSFGVVLWEMITGTRLFRGESVAHTLADVLRADIDFTKLPRDTPEPIRNLLARCLDRNVSSRLSDLGEARLIMERCLADPASAAEGAPPRTRTEGPLHRRRAWIWTGIGSAVLVAGIAATILRSPYSKRSIPDPQQFRQITNFPDSATSPALSRDGHMLAFARGGNWFLDKNEIYVKLLPDGPSVQLTHDGVPKAYPAFSPDGGRIAYMVAGFDTWVVPVLAGGAPRLMLKDAEGLTWIDSQRILFSENHSGGMGLETATENRTSQREIYLPKPVGMAHFSTLSPDGKQVLVVEMVGSGPFIPCRLLPFDGRSRGRQVGPRSGSCTAAVWSPDGKWMYFTANAGGRFHVWRQRSDSDKAEQITFGPSEEQGLAMAPDGKSLYTSVGTGHSSVWLHDAHGDRQVSGEGNAGGPLFSKDGSHLFYQSQRRLWSVDLQTGRADEVLPGITFAGASLSRDGISIVYVTPDKSVWMAALDRTSAPRKIPLQDPAFMQMALSGKLYFAATEGNKLHSFSMNVDGSERKELFPGLPGAFLISPDERWALDRDGRGPGIGVRLYPLSGGASMKFCGRCQARWSEDGKTMIATFRAVAGFPGVTVAVPLKGRAMFPPLPPNGFQGPDEMIKLPGALMIPFEFAAIGPRMSSYAYTKENRQANIFQIPLP